MHKKILITGAGQLGSRYLQGLAKVSAPLQIFVQDISSNSLDRAKLRWDESKNPDSLHQISFIQNFNELPGSIDIAIVSTVAEVRPEVVEMVADATNVSYWILEKVLAQNLHDINRISSVVVNSKGAWVNTARRIMKWHQEMKSRIGETESSIMEITGGGWGLACNAVHFLDLFSWWTGEQLKEVDTKGLNTNWKESKRSGYFEVFGVLEAKFSGGSKATMSAVEEVLPHIIRFADHTFEWTIDETRRLATRSDGMVINGEIEMQSTLTAGLINDIIKTGTCGLPGFHESAAMHRVFLEALQAHWNKQPDKQKDILPIT